MDIFIREGEIPGFRNPKEWLKNFIFMQGYEGQGDQTLFDRVDDYTHETALQVLTIIGIRLEVVKAISQQELTEFILSDDWIEPVVETPRVLH